jgi:hypothetical protein
LAKATAQATSRKAKRPTASQANSLAPVCTASPAVPVATVPTGKVKLHQVSEKERPPHSARTVISAAIAIQVRAKPQTGSP